MISKSNTSDDLRHSLRRRSLSRNFGVGFGIAVIFGGTVGVGILRLPDTIAGEDCAANCIRVNDRVLFAAGYPRTTEQLRSNGFDPLLLDMSEFQKMDGVLSFRSLRF
jgi:hypothetical protein